MFKNLLLVGLLLVSASAFAETRVVWNCEGDNIEVLQIRAFVRGRHPIARYTDYDATLSWDVGPGDYIESRDFGVNQVSPLPGRDGGATVFATPTVGRRAPRFTLTIETDSRPTRDGFRAHVTARTPMLIDQDVVCSEGRGR